MHRAILLCQEETILPEHLSLTLSNSESDTPTMLRIGQTLAEAEKEFILSTLDHCVGDYGQAAHLLGLSLRALRAKLKEYGKTHGLDDPTPSSPQAVGSC